MAEQVDVLSVVEGSEQKFLSGLWLPVGYTLMVVVVAELRMVDLGVFAMSVRLSVVSLHILDRTAN